MKTTSADAMTSHQAIALQIAQLLLRHRRRTSCNQTLLFEESNIIAIQSPRIQAFVARGACIDLILPAFPAKSPNPRKVLGKHPDMAERLALSFLDRLCRDIQAIYSPGARIIICSDGHVFADLIEVSDDDVIDYQKAIKALIADMQINAIEVFNLGDVPEFSDHADNYDQQRKLLCEFHAETPERIKQRLLGHSDGLQLYRAITRFMLEDRWTDDASFSRTALQKKSRQIAISVIQRSEAWGNLLSKRFPQAIRLSIHPQASTSIKMGIHLMDTHDNWLTPWHGVALKHGNGYSLMKRKDAESQGAQLIYLDGKPSHYVISSECNHKTGDNHA
jgi:pyoverdine/dityrosine biosynthesis protein Dit1